MQRLRNWMPGWGCHPRGEESDVRSTLLLGEAAIQPDVGDSLPVDPARSESGLDEIKHTGPLREDNGLATAIGPDVAKHPDEGLFQQGASDLCSKEHRPRRRFQTAPLRLWQGSPYLGARS